MLHSKDFHLVLFVRIKRDPPADKHQCRMHTCLCKGSELTAWGDSLASNTRNKGEGRPWMQERNVNQVINTGFGSDSDRGRDCTGVQWERTVMDLCSHRPRLQAQSTHNAGCDSRANSNIFPLMLLVCSVDTPPKFQLSNSKVSRKEWVLVERDQKLSLVWGGVRVGGVWVGVGGSCTQWQRRRRDSIRPPRLRRARPKNRSLVWHHLQALISERQGANERAESRLERHQSLSLVWLYLATVVYLPFRHPSTRKRIEKHLPQSARSLSYSSWLLLPCKLNTGPFGLYRLGPVWIRSRHGKKR